MQPSQYISELSNKAKNRKLIVFCGAGVSMLAPSNSPSWWEIYSSAAEALLKRFYDGFPEYTQKVNLNKLLAVFSTQQLANLVVNHFAGNTFVEMLKIVDNADPNENHRHLVNLSANNYLAGIITTNFDTLLERTAAIYGTSFSVLTNEWANRYSNTLSNVPLIKLHGTAVDSTNLSETLDQKAREINADLVGSWMEIIQGCDLLVLGYSGADLNFGAVQAFFQAFDSLGANIFWLHRPNNKPNLIIPFNEKSNFIEGELPYFLRDLMINLNLNDFETPVQGHDCQSELKRAMEYWSKELHIGAWSAASFLLSIMDHIEPDGPNSDLYNFLMALAISEAKKLRPGAILKIKDFAVTGFLNIAGIMAMNSGDFKSSVLLHQTVVNIHEGFWPQFEINRNEPSFQENRMNLSTVWNNLGHSCLLMGNKSDALIAFKHSMINAYLGGHIKGFLIAHTNVINYGLEQISDRKSLISIDAGVDLADRYGAVQPSIELRLLAVIYHFNRNEIWLANKILSEAVRRAEVSGDKKSLAIARFLEGGILLKRGLFEKGLTIIATVTNEMPNTAFFSKPFEEIRKFLTFLGIPQPEPFIINLDISQVTSLVFNIESKQKDAKESKKIPFQGQPFCVPASTIVNKHFGRMLFEIGFHEFEGNTNGSITVGLQYTQEMLKSNNFHDAIWAAENILANDNANEDQRGFAYAYLAHSNAGLARLEFVNDNLYAAKHAFEKVDVDIPLYLAQIGLWHSIQSSDIDNAINWGKILLKGLINKKDIKSIIQLIENIDTWSPKLERLSSALLYILQNEGIVIPIKRNIKSESPFRYFTGITADLLSSYNEQVFDILNEGHRLLSANDIDNALELIESFVSNTKLIIPDWQLGLLMELKVSCLANKLKPEEFVNSLDVIRKKLLDQYSFTALTCLEGSIISRCIAEVQLEIATDILKNHIFIGEFSYDPLVKAKLFSLETDISTGIIPALTIRSKILGYDKCDYFGIERWSVAKPSSNNKLHLDNLANSVKVQKEFIELLKTAKDIETVKSKFEASIRSLKTSGSPADNSMALLEGEYANWLLSIKLFDDARYYYQKAEKNFRIAGDQDNTFNSMVGIARAWSREGHYQKAIEAFKLTLNEATDSQLKPNILLGLASAQLLEAQHNLKDSYVLRKNSIKTYKEAIVIATKENLVRPMARLGLARALGELGEQDQALQELDQAITELSNLGSPNALMLKKNRYVFESGNWSSLGLS